MKSTCEAVRRDGAPCPNPWTHCLHTSEDHDRPQLWSRSVYLCGVHHSQLHKGVMVVNLAPTDEYRDAFVNTNGAGGYFFTGRKDPS